MKRVVELPPDDRWQYLVETHDDLVAVAAGWRVDVCVPEPVAAMLGTSRALFAHRYFVYEFLVVAVTWSLIAVEPPCATS